MISGSAHQYSIFLFLIFKQFSTQQIPGFRSDTIYNLPSFESCGQSEVPSSRAGLYEGRWHGSQGEFPWVVSFKWNRQSYCEGVVINANWVLTAAHCFDIVDAPSVELVIGEHDTAVEEPSEQVRKIAQYVPHEAYNPETNENDIALLRLDRPLKFGRYAQPICLPDVHLAPSMINCTYSGWGVSNNENVGRRIKGRPLRLLPLDTCLQEYRETYSVLEQHICAEFENASTSPCLGDSGGPLTCHMTDGSVAREVVLGVTSMGPEDCGDSPVVYINVVHFLDWISKILTDFSTR